MKRTKKLLTEFSNLISVLDQENLVMFSYEDSIIITNCTDFDLLQKIYESDDEDEFKPSDYFKNGELYVCHEDVEEAIREYVNLLEDKKAKFDSFNDLHFVNETLNLIIKWIFNNSILVHIDDECLVVHRCDFNRIKDIMLKVKNGEQIEQQFCEYDIFGIGDNINMALCELRLSFDMYIYNYGKDEYNGNLYI